MLTHVPFLASNPMWVLETFCLLTISSASNPAFSAIWCNGASKDSNTTLIPFWISELLSLSVFFKSLYISTRAAPPPITIPSLTAAFVALSASSILNFFSLSSLSVNAPTLIKATPPVILATLSRYFFLSYSDVELSACFFNSSTRASNSSFEPAPSIKVVLSFVTVTFLALPKSFIVISFNSMAKSLE